MMVGIAATHAAFLIKLLRLDCVVIGLVARVEGYFRRGAVISRLLRSEWLAAGLQFQAGAGS
jgi:hypothetical protein